MKRITAARIRLSLRKKLIGISLILLIIPIVSLGVTAYYVSLKETTSLIESKLSTNVSLVIEMIENMEISVQNKQMSKEDAQERIKATLLGELQSDGTRPINSNLDLGKHGYFYILNEKGDLISHPSMEGENLYDNQAPDGTYYIQDVIKAGLNGGGTTYYQWPLNNDNSVENASGKATKITYSKQSPAWGWIIVAGSYMQDFNEGHAVIVEAMIMTLVICIVAGGIIVYLFSQHLAKPIIKLTEAAERMASGDLTGEVINIRNRDEIGRLGSAFATLFQNLQQIIGNLTLSSHTLTNYANQLSLTTHDTMQAINQTTHAISEVASDNETQAQATIETARAMNEMSDGIGRVADSTAQAHAMSLATLEEAENGNQLITETTQQILVVHDSVEDVNTSVAKLNEQSEQIEEIVKTIKDISSQTNLLALNAAIEAARAGEEGRGFAIVAGEVRKLSESTSASAEQISALVEDIRRLINNTSESMSKSQTEVARAVEDMKNTGKSFTTIVDSTRTVVEQISETSAVAQQMSASSEEIAATISQIEQISMRTSGAAQNVSVAAEEQLASLNQIDSSVQKLKSMSEDMKKRADDFKLS